MAEALGPFNTESLLRAIEWACGHCAVRSPSPEPACAKINCATAVTGLRP
jgi:hypothetical protein